MYLTDYLMRHAQNQKAKTAVSFEGDQITWGQLCDKVINLSGFFSKQLGVKDQQVVTIVMTNSIDFIVVYLAALHAGHIVMPVDPAYKKLEIDAMIERLAPAMIIYQSRYARQIGDHKIPVYDSAELLSKKYSTGAQLRISPDKQVASLTSTSGTSGSPKTVPNTHANHIWNIEACSEIWGWTGDDTLLLALPLSHMHGLVIGLSGAVYHGNTIYLRQQNFDAKDVLGELSSGRISFFTHGPIAYSRMLEERGDYDLSKVRVMISGSAPFPPQLWRDFKDRFGVEVIETYGTSETGRIAGNRPGAIKLGSPGKPMPGADVKTLESGELAVKSPGVFPGYWHNPQATRKAATEDGFWRTGDIAEIKDGYVYLKGRTQERIRKFGYTVSPRDVEWALLENPKIKEAFVLGIQAADGPNDMIHYFITGDINEKDVADYCKDNLPFSWRADKVWLLTTLPRTSNGKPHVKKMQEMAGHR